MVILYLIAGYLLIGLILAVTIYFADIYWVDKSVQPKQYRFTLEDIKLMCRYYLWYPILYPFFIRDDWHTIVEYVKDILFPDDKIIKPDHDNEFVKLNKPEEESDD